MKKLRLLLCAVWMLVMPEMAHAYVSGDKFTIDGITYCVEDVSAATVSVRKVAKAGAVVIPATVFDGKDMTFTVVKIGGTDDGSVDFTGVTSITLPNTIKFLGTHAFRNSSITTLHIPASVQDVRAEIFIGWAWEQTFSHMLPRTLASITVDASSPYFEAADGVLYSKGKKAIIAYPKAKTGSTFTIPDGVEEIWASTFSDNQKGLSKIIVPASVKKISELAYSICPYTPVTAIEVSESNPYYCSVDGVLFNKAKTRLVFFPKNKNSGGSYAVPAGCKEIATHAFMDALITSISLNDVATINYRSFYGARLRTVEVSDNLVSIDGNAFDACMWMSNFTVAPGTTRYAAVDGVLFSGDKKTLMRYPPARAGASYTIPEGTTKLGNGCMQNCGNLETVNIAASVDSMCGWTMRYCDKLSRVVFPANSKLKYFNGQEFVGTKIQELAFPASLEIFATGLGDMPMLKKVTFADNSQLQYIPNNCFQQCPSLEEVTFLGRSVLQTIGNTAFYTLPNFKSFSVPATVTNIGYRAFASCPELKTVTFADDAVIERIGTACFAESGLESITLPPSLKTIDREAFRNCNVLQTAELGSRVSSVSPEAFKGCYNLQRIVVDKANTTYSSIDGMLLTKDKETLVLFPPGKANDKFTLLAPSIRTIGDYAFYQNERLTNVVIPNRVTSLGRRAFGLCPNLNTLTLLCDNFLDPANIKQLLNEATFDDGNTTETDGRANIDLHVRKELLTQYEGEPFYDNYFKSINPSFSPMKNPASAADGTNNLEEYIAVSENDVSLIKANSDDKTYVVPTTVYKNRRTPPYTVGMIGDYAFHGCSSGIEEVVVPGAVSYLGAKSFLSDTTNVDASSIRRVFLVAGAQDAETFSTVRFELDDTGRDYSEFADNTKVYVKKSVFNSADFQSAITRYTVGNSTHPRVRNMFGYKITDDIKITGGKYYGTFAREFDVDLSDFTSDPANNAANCRVFAFTGAKDGVFYKGPGDGVATGTYYIRMTSINLGQDGDGTYIPAGTGVLLKTMDDSVTEEDFYYTIGEKDVNQKDETSLMVGVTRRDTIVNDDNFDIFVVQMGQFQSLKGRQDVRIPVHKAYLQLAGLPQSNGAKSFVFTSNPADIPADAVKVVLGGTSAIGALDEGFGMQDEGPVYDLQGRKVSASGSLKAGIYVKNGRKIIVK